MKNRLLNLLSRLANPAEIKARLLLRLGLENKACAQSSYEMVQKVGYARCREMYYFERDFHRRLLAEGNAQKRQKLYKDFYQEHYRRTLEFFPQKRHFGFNESYIRSFETFFKDQCVLDYGCGYGNSTRVISEYAKTVTGVDVSADIIEKAKTGENQRENITYAEVSGTDIAFDEESFDRVYSNDVVEHMHPEDFSNHLKEVHRVLREGGAYYIFTPSAHTGPHDISALFFPRQKQIKATGGHIREFYLHEMVNALKRAGFSRVELPDLSFPQILLFAWK